MIDIVSFDSKHLKYIEINKYPTVSSSTVISGYIIQCACKQPRPVLGYKS